MRDAIVTAAASSDLQSPIDTLAFPGFTNLPSAVFAAAFPGIANLPIGTLQRAPEQTPKRAEILYTKPDLKFPTKSASIASVLDHAIRAERRQLRAI